MSTLQTSIPAAAFLPAARAATPAAAWEEAARCHAEGGSDVEAIRRAYPLLPTPAYLSTVATIAAALYADRYWRTCRMDPEPLAAALHEAGGWNRGSCALAATAAFTTWHGLKLRANADDVGLLPSRGCANDSPDVLCGPRAVGSREALAGWDRRIFHAVPGRPLRVQVRASSLSLPVPIRRASVRMYAAPAGFNPPPGTWTPLLTPGGDEASPFPALAPHGRALASLPFAFRLPEAGYGSLIALASTEHFTGGPPAETGNWDYREWLKNHGAVGWHGMGTPPGPEASLRFHNLDATPEWFSFKMYAARVPLDTEITVECADPRLAEPYFKQVKVGASYHPFRVTERQLPPGFAGDLSVRIATPDGAPLPPEASIEMRMMWYLPPEHPSYALVADRAGYRPGEEPLPVEGYVASYTFAGAAR